MQWRLVTSGIALIAATYGLARFGYGLFLPRFTEAFELGPALSGAIQAGSFLSYCVTALLAARMGSRPRRVIVFAGAAAALGSAGVAAAPNAGALALSIVIAGAGAGFATPGLVTLIERNIRPERQENAQTIVNSGTGAGIVAAGVLMILTIGQWRLGWAAISAVVVLATVATLRADTSASRAPATGSTPATGNAPATGCTPESGAPQLGRKDLAQLLWPLGAAALAGASSAAIWTFGRTVMAAGAQDEMYSIGAWMVLGAFGILGAGAGRIVQAWSLRTAWTITTLLMAGATLLLGAVPGAPIAAYAAAALFGASYTAMSGVLIVWAVRTVPAQASAGTVALFIALAVGQAAGSVGLGAVLRPEAPLPAFALATAIGVLALLPALARREQDPARNEARSPDAAAEHSRR